MNHLLSSFCFPSGSRSRSATSHPSAAAALSAFPNEACLIPAVYHIRPALTVTPTPSASWAWVIPALSRMVLNTFSTFFPPYIAFYGDRKHNMFD